MNVNELVNTLVEDVNVEPEQAQAVEETRERNLHKKKHRRQLLSPPAAAG